MQTEKNKITDNQVSLRRLVGLLIPIFHKHRIRLAGGLMALLGVNFLQLTVPRILKHGIDRISESSINSHDLLFPAAAICLIGLTATMLRFTWRYLIIGFSRHLERDLRQKIISHVMVMDGSFFNRYSTGAIMSHTSNDLSAVQMACGMGLVATIDATVMSMAAIGFMMGISVKLTLLALTPMPFLALSTRFLSGRLHKRFDLVQEQFSSMTEFVRSSVSSIRLIKAYTLEKSQTNRFEKLGRNYVHSSIRVAVIQGLLFPVASLAGSLGMLLVLFYGGQLVMKETISMGDFVAFITYLYMLIWPIMAIGWVANLSQRGITSLRRIFRLLQTKSAIPPGGIPCAAGTRSFACRHLNFSYPQADRPTLTDINLHLDSSITAVSGPTGSGKTTLCQLLTRMFPIPDNSIFVGEDDINKLQPESVRNLISYMGQEALLFSRTITENISFGAPESSPEQIREAAEIAAIHEEIMALENGYDSIVGERGINLSGGQRQRICLARALLCDRPIVIIDDALAAVDTATENKILSGIRAHLKGKTVLWVSQRIKQLQFADQVLILEDGKACGPAPYEKLLKRNAFLSNIHHRQTVRNRAGENSNA